jgi:hypothetical protein
MAGISRLNGWLGLLEKSLSHTKEESVLPAAKFV